MLSTYVESLFDCFQVSLKNSHPPPQLEEATRQARQSPAKPQRRRTGVSHSIELPVIHAATTQHPPSVTNNMLPPLLPIKHWPLPLVPTPRAVINMPAQSQSRRLQEDDTTFRSAQESTQIDESNLNKPLAPVRIDLKRLREHDSQWIDDFFASTKERGEHK